MLAGKRIVLGVTGGIAAYKAVEVCRRLVDAGAHVVPVLTEGALHFVGRTTFDALGSERAWTSLWDEPHPIPHTHLGQTADLVLVAPATARILGLYAAGISDDLLTNTLLATRAPGAGVPRPCTPRCGSTPRCRTTCARSRAGRARGGARGGPPGRRRRRRRAPGRARDDRGRGRARAQRAGPRRPAGARHGRRHREPIDPVRFIGNRSSGKQGHALAEEAAARGAKVTLVTTTGLPVSAGIDAVRVATAAEMEHAVLSRADGADVVVMAAAVADFRPVQVAASKIKKADGVPEIVLEPTTDILAALGARKRPGPDHRRLRRRDRRRRRQRPTSSPARAPTSSWPTTCRPPAWASSTTPTP